MKPRNALGPASAPQRGWNLAMVLGPAHSSALPSGDWSSVLSGHCPQPLPPMGAWCAPPPPHPPVMPSLPFPVLVLAESTV